VVATREQVLHARNDETISAQVESLRLSVDRRRLWLQDQIQEGRYEPIIRMRRAQLSRLESEFDAKLATLEAKRGVSFGYRLVAAGLVTSPGGLEAWRSMTTRRRRPLLGLGAGDPLSSSLGDALSVNVT